MQTALHPRGLAVQRAISKAECLISEKTYCKHSLKSSYCTAETVADPASTARDNQDIVSGEPPSDVTTKYPLQDLTEVPSTGDYVGGTYTEGEDEEGKRDMIY